MYTPNAADHPKNSLFLLLLVLAFAACGKDPLDGMKFNPPGKQYDLVVEGGITTFQKTQYIRLTEPVFSVDSSFHPARGATVTIFDGASEVSFKETTTPGVYSGLVLNNTNYNHAYRLTVKYKNKVYTAVDTLRQVVNIIDDFLPLGTIKQTSGDIRLNIPKHTFGFLNSCKWLIIYNGLPAWNPANFDESTNYTYTHSQGSPNSIYPLINQTRQAVMPPTDYVYIFKFSLSEAYSNYLYSVFQETDWKGIFSAVPGEIKGNLSEGANGFFSVVDVDVRRYRASELAN